MVKRPYLTTQIDAQYQLTEQYEGCFNLWGNTYYRGTYQHYTVDFIPHRLYKTAQADGGPALELSIILPRHDLPTMREMQPYHVHRWLAEQTPPKNDLMTKSHQATEKWRVKDTRLSLIIVWERQAIDYNDVPNCVERLVAVADVIRDVSIDNSY